MLTKLPNGLDERRIRLIRHRLTPLLKTCFGYHGLCYSLLGEQLGMKQCPVRAVHYLEESLPANRFKTRADSTSTLKSKVVSSKEQPDLIADFCQLPIASDSIDLILLPASLQLAEDPHGILREAERVLIPEGKLIIIGRNPFSWQGLVAAAQRLFRLNQPASAARDISRFRLKDWLKLLGLELEEEIGISLTNEKIQLGRASKWTKRFSNYFCEYFCSYFILIAEKRVSTLTPIRPSWRRNKRLVPPRVAEPTVRGQVKKWCINKNH